MFMFNNRTYGGPHKHYKNIYCRTKLLYRTKTSVILQLFYFSAKVFTLEIRFSIQYRCILLAQLCLLRYKSGFFFSRNIFFRVQNKNYHYFPAHINLFYLPFLSNVVLPASIIPLKTK